MKTENLTPQQSFDLISEIIQEARSKFGEDGVIYTMWGALLVIASLGQYLLLTNGYEQINYYPYFILPLGGVISWWYYRKKVASTKGNNQITKINSILWLACSINMFVLGFLLHHLLLQNLIPVILLLLSIALLVSGSIIKSSILQFSGVFTNVAAIVSFFVDWQYQPLMTTLVAFVAILIPGILLMRRYKK